MPHDDTDQLAGELSELFGELVGVDLLTQNNQPGARLSVCNMSYRPSQSGTDSTPRQRITQTAVVLDADELDLPQFALSPHAKGIFGALLNRLGDFGDIDFDDSPEFSEAYHLMGWIEESVRVLFTRAVRDHFATRPGWSIRAKGRRLVIFQHNHTCNEQQRDGFVGDCLEILTLFREAESQLDARPDIRRKTRPQDMAASAERMGGLVGSILQNQLRRIAVTEDELETFLNESPPRNIPPGMKRQILGDNLMLVFVGVLFCLAGLIGGTVALNVAKGDERWIGVLFLIMFPLIGGLMAGLTIRFRRRKARVLQHGSQTEGIIEKIAASAVMVNNQVRHYVTIRYEAGSSERSTVCNTYGGAVDRARELQADSNPVRVLVDPRNPDHIVCVDLLILFS